MLVIKCIPITHLVFPPLCIPRFLFLVFFAALPTATFFFALTATFFFALTATFFFALTANFFFALKAIFFFAFSVF